MDGLQIIILRKVCHKERQILYDVTYMWTIKYDTNKPTHKTETDSHGEHTCGCQRGREMRSEFRISKCKLLCIQWIKNKVLLHSTRNYIQYPIINYKGKEKKEKSQFLPKLPRWSSCAAKAENLWLRVFSSLSSYCPGSWSLSLSKVRF